MENRIIKFRAWDGDKIIYQSEDGWFDKVKHPEYQSPQCMQFASVMRVCKIMQFTGLTDKNGVEIYEGDVLMYIGTNMSSMVVKFENGCFVGCGPFNALPLIDYINASDFQSIEVIGNVFENPELLNP